MITILVNMKQAGKRKDVLKRCPYSVTEDLHSLQEVLTWFTIHEVEKYNAGKDDFHLLIPASEEIQNAHETGKIGFGYSRSDKRADPEEAVETTVSAFKDGLVRVFLNDNELKELQEEIALKEGDVLTFVRLTFLTGRMW